MRRTIWLSVLLLASGPALAHTGHEVSGFLHPFTGADHVLVMVGVGLWTALLAARNPAAVVLVPVAFLGMMAIGAGAGFAGINLPLAEAAILASLFVTGGLIMGAVRLPVLWAMAVVGLFAAFHGYAHAMEGATAQAGGYILGFLAATALLQGFGLILGWGARRAAGDLGVRALGGVMLAAGAALLIGQ